MLVTVLIEKWDLPLKINICSQAKCTKDSNRSNRSEDIGLQICVQTDMKFDRQLRPATETSRVVSNGGKQFQDGGRPPF